VADLFQSIIEVFDRLGLWDDGVELIGSWSLLLYQRHCGVRPYPLRTQDIDFLVPRIYPQREAVDLAGALAPLGFHVDFSPLGAIHFRHPDLKIEFLTPERGKGDDAPRAIKPLGINAVQLRFLDMLFDNPLTVKENGVTVNIPNPTNFCIHKLIIAQRRTKRDKTEKDIEQAVHVLSILDPEEFRLSVQKLPKKWRAMVIKSLQRAESLVPSELATLAKFDLTQQNR
jgi:hypothetical protein